MIKNFKHMWKHHRSFCLLSWSYLVPAFIVFLATRDTELAQGAGAVGILAASPFIWKFS